MPGCTLLIPAQLLTGRPTSALRKPCPPRWRWVIVRLDAEGRVCLPGNALVVLGAAADERAVVRGTCNRVGLVLHRDGAAPLSVDSRGRVLVPVWLRRAAGESGSVVVGTRTEDHLVLVAPVAVLDGLGNMLVGGTQ